MKKTYINPTLDVVEIRYQHQLLAGSTLGIDPTVQITDEGDLLSREMDFDDEEDDFDFDEEEGF
jgi:hypothetical protein